MKNLPCMECDQAVRSEIEDDIFSSLKSEFGGLQIQIFLIF